jgi:hypothetical protein
VVEVALQDVVAFVDQRVEQPIRRVEMPVKERQRDAVGRESVSFARAVEVPIVPTMSSAARRLMASRKRRSGRAARVDLFERSIDEMVA